MYDLVKNLNISDSQYINALLVIVSFVLIALLVNLFIVKVLKKLVKFTKSDLDDKIIDIIHTPIFLTIILMAISYAVTTVAPGDRIVKYSDNIIYTVLVLLWAYALIRSGNLVLDRIINRFSDSSGLDKSIMPLLGNVLKIAIIIGGLMSILSIWKVDITPLLASAGIVGVAVAVASKDTLSNFFGGISVYLDKPYRIGDYIELDDKERGEVVHIGVRSTRIKTRDDILISLPNSIIANSKVVNESAPIPQFRIRIPIGVAYGSDIDLVEQTLLEIAEANENILPEPEPRVRFRKFGDSSLDFELLCWAAEPSVRGLTIHELNKAIYKAFARKSIQIPFPQRDIHFFNHEKKDQKQ